MFKTETSCHKKTAKDMHKIHNQDLSEMFQHRIINGTSRELLRPVFSIHNFTNNYTVIIQFPTIHTLIFMSPLYFQFN